MVLDTKKPFCWSQQWLRLHVWFITTLYCKMRLITLQNATVVIYAATWVILKPNLEKIKKVHPEKKFLYFRKWNFLAPKQLSYTLNKTPLRKTGCMSSLYYLLAAQASRFLIHEVLAAIGHQILHSQPFVGKQSISLGVTCITRMCLCLHC